MAAKFPRLKALRGQFVGGRTSILLNRTPLRLGRDPAQNDVALPARDRSISRQHLELIQEADRWVLVDHSRHGVYVNDELVQRGRRELQHGDRIAIGDSMELLFDDSRRALAAERPSVDQDTKQFVKQHLDPETMIVWRDGLLLDIRWSVEEFALLRFLYQRHGQLCRYDEIIKAVWGDAAAEHSYDDMRDLVAQVRRKLEPDPAHPAYLVTRPGLGYVLVAAPEVRP